MSVDVLNARLYTLYTGHWQTLVDKLPTDQCLSNPLLLRVPEGYISARRKLLVIGQQTNGWGPGSKQHHFGDSLGNDPVTELMDLYERFAMGKKLRHTPFWRAVHQLHGKLNPDIGLQSFVWSNLLKVDQCQKCPDREYQDIVCLCRFVQSEIRILAPEVVVFFTGPRYDERLRKDFEDIRMKELRHKSLYHLEHPTLPVHSYKTYHPNYLQQSNKWEILDQIVALASP